MTTPKFHLVNDQFLRLLRGQVSQEDADNILHTLMSIGLTVQTADAVANTLLCAQVLEPFGHFKPEPFGWTDCAKDDEGAIALYEHPAKPAREVATLSLAAEDVHAAFAKNFPKTRISQAWINFATDIAQAIAARAAKPAQEVVLTNRQFDLICQAIDQADTVTMDGDYMMDSDDCIRVVRVMQALFDTAALRAKGCK